MNMILLFLLKGKVQKCVGWKGNKISSLKNEKNNWRNMSKYCSRQGEL